MRVVAAIAGTMWAVAACAPADRTGALPARLSDAEFRALITTISEPAGTFPHSENLVSNEAQFATLAQRLRPRGGVYIGVGPEQNFSYIARLEPAMAFVVDIRRENRNLHLLYKALFEMSDDRGGFVSRLFSRPRPSALAPHMAVRDLFDAYDNVPPSASMREETAQRVRELLIRHHGLALIPEDLQWIDGTLEAFRAEGPAIHYGRGLPATAAGPSYRSLMTATDLWREPRSFLASEEAFAFVKGLHARNLIVPVIGNFAGPTALLRIGEYVRQHGAVVSALYSSNVEVYLSRDELRTFCGHAERLPHDRATWFITSRRLQRLESKLARCAAVPPSLRWSGEQSPDPPSQR